MKWLMVISLAVAASVAAAQPLSGTYTCANGNPSAAYDYADIGDFFDDLEALGMAGPVTLNVYDDGGPFISKINYMLGADYSPTTQFPTDRRIVGLGPSSPLRIGAASGESPEIVGNGAVLENFINKRGALYFNNISYTTVQGLTIHGADYFGIAWEEYWGVVQPFNYNISVTDCRIYNIAEGAAIFIRRSDGNCKIENNMCWSCKGYGYIYTGIPAVATIQGVIGFYTLGPGCTIKNNTVLHTSGAADSSAFFNFSVQTPVSVFEGNVVLIYHSSSTWLWHPGGGSAPMPLYSNYNVVHLGGQAKTGVGNGSWAAWQAAGYDANGVNADPLLVNVSPGNEDLRLQPGSPARDLIPVSTLTQDAFGNPRPMGLRYDAGAHEYPEPEIEVSLGSTGISSGGSQNLGNVYTVGEARTFTIYNPHPADLLLTGSPAVMLAPGANCDAATGVTGQPAVTTLPKQATATFTLFIDPSGVGAFDLQVSIASNDADENPFYFTLTGTGVVNAPAQADPAPGSSFSGPANGPMVLTLNPGAALANAVIGLTDAEADLITVTSITPPATLPAGISGPLPPAPGHPISLGWSGVADAFNPPGAYSWLIEFVDAVSGTQVTCTVTIVIPDVPPTHLPAGMTPGDGSPGSPYLAAYLTGADSGQVTELCVLSDANAAQSVGMGAVMPGAGNPAGGAGFVIDVAGGVLRAAPAAVLSVADVGTHEFTVTITDSTNLLDVHVRLTVSSPPPLAIATSILPNGEIGKGYAQAIQTTGGSGAISFAVISGQLPPGLSLGAGGAITGTPTQQGTFNLTVQAADMYNIATRTYDLRVLPASLQPPGTDNGGDDSGCTLSGTHSSSPANRALALAALVLWLGTLALAARVKHPAH